MTTVHDTDYAFNAFGGFKIDQSFPTYRPQGEGYRAYNLRDTIQLKYSTRALNMKIGIVTDSTGAVVSRDVDSATGLLNDDELDINTTDFLNYVGSSNVITMGAMATLYSDYLETINTYFGSHIVLNNNIFNINGGVFDAAAFAHLINGGTFNVSGSFVTDIQGNVTVYSMNDKLRHATDKNIFGNRTPGVTQVSDGVIDGDMFYVPDGLTVTLKLNIDNGANIDIYSGPANLKKIEDKLNYYNSATRVRKTTDYSNTHITQTYTVPILLVATDLAIDQPSLFATIWTPALTSLGNRDWNTGGISSTGQYQTIVDVSGNIYKTNDFGGTWTFAKDIGGNALNHVAISADGQYQIGCNGTEIFVSTNYGVSWVSQFTLPGTLVNLSISLNGQYMNVIVSGDNVYRSTDYGSTWAAMPTGTDLYYSVQAFPTSGTAMSYDGRYQVFATETVYLSTDFGATFNDVFTPNDPFDDRNWVGIAISSDGNTIFGADSGGKLLLTQNQGAAWSELSHANLGTGAKTWRHIAMSSDATYMIAVEDNGNLYASSNGGSAWFLPSDPDVQGNHDWRWCALSSNGQYALLLEHGGTPYTSTIA